MAMRLPLLFDSLSLLSASSFNSFCVAAATVWLFYRAYLVLNKPLDELVGLLGFEIPQGPLVDLAAVKADGAILHWKPADDRRTTHRYEVQINGTVVGEVQQSESSIVLSNLQPDHNYIFRIIVVNSLDFRSASEPVRIRTKSADSGDLYNAPSAPTPPDGSSLSTTRSGPVVRPFKSLPETFSGPATAPAMTRETSNGPGTTKRTTIGRRPSPATWTTDAQHGSFEGLPSQQGVEETQQQLTEKLEEIARDTAEVEKQVLDEEQEARFAKQDLATERDELKSSLKEKENLTKEFRKQVNALERENAAAQSKRSMHERALLQQKSEMQKLRDDAARWEHEVEKLRSAVKQFSVDKGLVTEEMEREKISLQDKHAQEMLTVRSVEEEIKSRSNQIKGLDREKNNSPINFEANEQHQRLLAEEAEEDRVWNERRQFLEDQYKAAWLDMEAARRLCQDASNQLHAVRQRQIELSHMVPPPLPTLNQPISRASSLHQRRTPSGPNLANATASSSFAESSIPSFGSGMGALPEGFTSSVSPFFNINNGMTLDRPMNGGSGLSPADIERLTGGAPMSPGAGAELLPAGLLTLADEDLTSRNSHSRNGGDTHDVETGDRQHSNGHVIPGLGAFSSGNHLPGLGASSVQALDGPGQGPASPISASSRSPSVFASPGASASNLVFNSSDYPVDSDGRSIRSTRSTRAASSGVAQTGSRFSQILGLHRQRGKTMPDDGLALGSLPKSQSQSVPRDAQGEDEPSNFGRRRNSSHSGNFFNSVLKSGSAAGKSEASEAATSQSGVAIRRRPFQMFGGKDGWPTMLGGDNRPASPRPGSTHSTELPRPSSENTRWGYWPSSESFGQRNSPLSADWGQAQPTSMSQGRTWGSRLPSRRPSAQYGGSGGVSYDIIEDDADISDISGRGQLQAPIGTRPSVPIERPPSPKLNPAAKDFKSLFVFGEKKEKGEKSSKGKSKDRENGAGTPRMESGSTPLATPLATPGSSVANGDGIFARRDEDHSPPQSRKSRDTRSVTTADSSINEFSIRSSLDHTPSQTPSDFMTPTSINGSANKESFMQKLSRKSSSGKFALPVFNRDRSKRGADKAKEAAVGEDQEGEDEDVLSRSIESMSRQVNQRPERVSRSWSSVFTSKIGKGKERNEEQTPSLSGASMTSEATGEDDEEQ